VSGAKTKNFRHPKHRWPSPFLSQFGGISCRFGNPGPLCRFKKPLAARGNSPKGPASRFFPLSGRLWQVRTRPPDQLRATAATSRRRISLRIKETVDDVDIAVGKIAGPRPLAFLAGPAPHAYDRYCTGLFNCLPSILIRPPPPAIFLKEGPYIGFLVIKISLCSILLRKPGCPANANAQLVTDGLFFVFSLFFFFALVFLFLFSFFICPRPYSTVPSFPPH